MRSGGNGDRIESRDNNQRETVDCGPDGGDIAVMDTIDATTRCEAEIRPGQPFVGVLGLARDVLRVSPGASARLTLRWKHPVSWRRLRSIRVVLRHGRRNLGRVNIRPREGRAKVGGRGLSLAPRSALSRSGATVTARLRLRRPAGRFGRLLLDVVATDVDGRRQVQRGAAEIRAR
jgi:hypothetical protein